MISKYLKDIGVKEEDLPENWNLDDDRQKYWIKDREIYGFDERDTWSLDATFVYWIYPRLKMYNEVNCIDTNYHTFEYKSQTLTEQECIDRILKGLEIRIKDTNNTKEEELQIQEAYDLFALILKSLWW